MENQRREFFKRSLLAAGGVLGVTSASANCIITPAQTEGLFYPIKDQLDTDTDLVFVKGRNRQAKGEVVYIRGVIADQTCRPIENALVEIWQACESGKYNHPNDSSTAELDPNFQYWGKTLTNEKGEYMFRTIIPGHYPATNEWMRPAHVHFKVSLRGFEELVTQMYFKGDQFNSTDRILQSLTKEEKSNVIIDFQKINNQIVGDFNITLNKIL